MDGFHKACATNQTKGLGQYVVKEFDRLACQDEQ
jgi:hypothetical protein